MSYSSYHRGSSIDGTKASQEADTVSIADSGFGSGVTSDASLISSDSSNANSRAVTRAIPIVGTRLKIFKKEGDPASLRHYNAVRLIIEAEIFRRIDAIDHARTNMIVVRAFVIGEDEARATLRLTVLCAQDLEDAVRQVFALELVQVMLHLSQYSRPLDYYIMLDPPEHTHALLDVDLCSRDTYTTTYGTYCGMPTILRKNGRIRKVTLGGVIKATYGDGSAQMFGMIPDHAIRDIQTAKTCVDDPKPSAHTAKEEAFDLGSWLPHNVALGRPISTESLPGTMAQRAKPGYDWCLLDMKSPLPNLAVHPESAHGGFASHEILMAQIPVFEEGTSDPMLLLGASGGTRRGTISSTMGRIWLAHSASFVDTYLLELNEGTIQAGDSGGWVVHSAANHFFGHVVATDAFGDARLASTSTRTSENINAIASKEEMHKILNFTKREIRPVSKQVPLWDPKHVDLLNQQEVECNFLQAFFPPSGDATVDFELEAIQQLCAVTSATSEPDNGFRAYLDYQVKYTNTDTYRQVYSQSMTVAQLRQNLSQIDASPPLSHQANQQRYSEAEVDADRQLIYIDRLDRDIIHVLLKAVRHSHFDALANAIRKHVRRQTGLTVTFATQSIPHFQLELHVPYLTLRRSCDENIKITTTQQQHRIDIEFPPQPSIKSSFISYTITEAHHTVVISGTCDSHWVGFAFSDSSIVRSSEKDEEYAHGVREESVETVEEELEHTDGDVFQTPNCITMGRSETIWDPRLYFLMVCANRMGLVCNEYERMVSTIEKDLTRIISEVYIPIPTGSRRLKIKEFLEFLMALRRVLLVAKDNLSSVTNALESFWEQNGEVSYFSDMNDKLGFAQRSQLQRTGKAFKKFARKLDLLEGMIKDLNTSCMLQMEVENNEIARHNHALNLERMALHRRPVPYTCHSLEDAKHTTSAIKVNTSMVIIITPIFLVLQYFSTERPIFSFSRNSTSFLIAVLILMVSLPLLVQILYFIEIYGGKVVSAVLKLLGRPAPTKCTTDDNFDNTSSGVGSIDC
ncbi:hypothetical protein FB567DRAFT_604960 [Paraphoma chrysanthemicola]|uniref:Uncharacterized protein n=1 Tax=Paraphoma chrysanthemicola TaxID=798071 RepID=A0A8K0VX90_9PLEO|nr:hypothetical protein FB567DRAFT_604960 [Paraphoma chrysanthemicola]